MASTVEDVAAIGEGCLGFYDQDAGVGVNLVPLGPGILVPRAGDIVYLPGEQKAGAGSYEVVEVRYIYSAVDEKREPGQAQQVGIQVRVRRRH